MIANLSGKQIEAEIETSHYVIAKYTTRQVVCIAATAASILFVNNVVSNTMTSVIITLPIDILFIFFGFWHRDGLNAEDKLASVIQKIFYKNDKRIFKTRNKYVAIMNNVYKKLSAQMMSTYKSKYKKALGKKQKEILHRKKISKYVSLH